MLRYIIRKDWFCSSLTNQLHVMLHPGGHKVPSGVCPALRAFSWGVLGHGQVSREDEFKVLHPKAWFLQAQQFPEESPLLQQPKPIS